jgi:hypothetical protein
MGLMRPTLINQFKINYFFMPEIESSFETSLETFFKIVQLPFDVFNVNATHELLDSHKAWHASTFLYFFEVLTVEILPFKTIFSLASKFMSLAKAGSEINNKPVNNDLIDLFILVPLYM